MLPIDLGVQLDLLGSAMSGSYAYSTTFNPGRAARLVMRLQYDANALSAGTAGTFCLEFSRDGSTDWQPVPLDNLLGTVVFTKDQPFAVTAGATTYTDAEWSKFNAAGYNYARLGVLVTGGAPNAADRCRIYVQAA